MITASRAISSGGQQPGPGRMNVNRCDSGYEWKVLALRSGSARELPGMRFSPRVGRSQAGNG